MPDDRAPKLRQPLAGLAARIIFFVFAATLLTASVVGWIAVSTTRAFLWKSFEARFPHALSSAEERVHVRLDETGARLEALATPALRGTPSGEPAAAAVRGLLDAAPELDALGLAAPDGRILARAGAHAPWPALLPEAMRAGAGPRVSILAADGDARLLLVLPLHGEARGFLLAVPRRHLLQEILGRARSQDDDELLLVTRQGAIVASSAPVRTDDTLSAEAIRTDAGSAAREWSDAGGVRWVGGMRDAQTLDALLVVREPFATAFAPIFAVVTRVFVINLLVVVVFSLLAYRVTAAIVRPIEALSAGARRISQGQLDVEIPESRSNDEIGLLTRTFNDMTRRLRKNQGEIEAVTTQLVAQNQDLQRANEVLAQLSITDGLTKLHNHRFFQDHLTREIKRVNRTGEPLSILLADIDDFKRLNDRFGHAAGDELLVRIAALMNRSIRESDLVSRYGGEEFAIVAGGTDLAGAVTLAEKVREAIAESSFILDDSLRPTRVTVSIGVAQYKGDRKAFFHSADRALYRAKAEGKNCVREYGGSA